MLLSKAYKLYAYDVQDSILGRTRILIRELLQKHSCTCACDCVCVFAMNAGNV